MHIIIVGLGRMGFSLAEQLDEEGHQLLVVDPDPAAIERARNRLDVLALQESGFHLSQIEETNANDADFLVAVTGSDEVNLITCLMARRLGISRHIARIGNSRFAAELGEIEQITFVNPGEVTVERLETMVKSVGTTDSFEFADGAILLRALLVEEGNAIIGKSLAEIRDSFDAPFIVTMVKRGTEFFVARGGTVIEAQDTIYVVIEKEFLSHFIDSYGFQSKARRAVIFGASSIGCELCARLEESVDDVILVEPEAELVEEAATHLASTSLIHGTPFQQDLLEELKTGTADYFISASSNDEGNLAAAMMAKRLGARTTVTLTSQPEYVEIFEPLPHIDAVVSPILMSVGAIVRRVRSGRVHSLTMIAGRRGEAIELEVEAGAPVEGKALKDIKFPNGMVLAAVQGQEHTAIPIGSTVLKAGQHVVAVVLKEAVRDAMNLFGAS